MSIQQIRQTLIVCDRGGTTETYNDEVTDPERTAKREIIFKNNETEEELKYNVCCHCYSEVLDFFNAES